MEHTQINNLHAICRHMGKTLYEKYHDAVGNIGLHTIPYVLCAKTVFLLDIFFKIPFHRLTHGGEGKGKGH